jgi:hypothetical protein
MPGEIARSAPHGPRSDGNRRSRIREGTRSLPGVVPARPRIQARIVREVLTLVLTGAGVAPACAPAAPEPASPVAPAPTSGGSGVSESTPPSDPAALAELDRGERIIAVAGGDCAAACEALSVIVRARVKLCAPTTSSCADAERRETAATKQVASFCDPCATGGAGTGGGAAGEPPK